MASFMAKLTFSMHPSVISKIFLPLSNKNRTYKYYLPMLKYKSLAKIPYYALIHYWNSLFVADKNILFSEITSNGPSVVTSKLTTIQNFLCSLKQQYFSYYKKTVKCQNLSCKDCFGS